MLPLFDHLGSLLASPVRLIFAAQGVFTGHETALERVVTHRFIRVLKGSLTYVVDTSAFAVNAGEILLVPRGALRRWQVPEGHICKLLWCEFECCGFAPEPHVLFLADDRRGLEKAMLQRILSLWKFPTHLRGHAVVDSQMPKEISYVIEGEMKAGLARFCAAAKVLDERKPGKALSDPAHPEVRRALAWMEENFRLPDAAMQLRAHVSMNPEHFRRLFHRHLGYSPGAHLNRLRMNEAMNLLKHSALPVKAISGDLGFNDPLYFSRRFQQFWGLPPTEFRK